MSGVVETFKLFLILIHSKNKQSFTLPYLPNRTYHHNLTSCRSITTHSSVLTLETCIILLYYTYHNHNLNHQQQTITIITTKMAGYQASIGKQINSLKRSSGGFSFGTGSREGQQRIWISKEHGKYMQGVDKTTPGPIYDVINSNDS